MWGRWRPSVRPSVEPRSGSAARKARRRGSIIEVHLEEDVIVLTFDVIFSSLFDA